ncbi:hypothetical protein RugamoR64_48290 [Duganella rhizosphaerae]
MLCRSDTALLRLSLLPWLLSVMARAGAGVEQRRAAQWRDLMLQPRAAVTPVGVGMPVAPLRPAVDLFEAG